MPAVEDAHAVARRIVAQVLADHDARATPAPADRRLQVSRRADLDHPDTPAWRAARRIVEEVLADHAARQDASVALLPSEVATVDGASVDARDEPSLVIDLTDDPAPAPATDGFPEHLFAGHVDDVATVPAVEPPPTEPSVEPGPAVEPQPEPNPEDQPEPEPDPEDQPEPEPEPLSASFVPAEAEPSGNDAPAPGGDLAVDDPLAGGDRTAPAGLEAAPAPHTPQPHTPRVSSAAAAAASRIVAEVLADHEAREAARRAAQAEPVAEADAAPASATADLGTATPEAAEITAEMPLEDLPTREHAVPEVASAREADTTDVIRSDEADPAVAERGIGNGAIPASDTSVSNGSRDAATDRYPADPPGPPPSPVGSLAPPRGRDESAAVGLLSPPTSVPEEPLDVPLDEDPAPASPRRTGRWLLTTIVGAVALAFLFPLAVRALRELISLS